MIKKTLSSFHLNSDTLWNFIQSHYPELLSSFHSNSYLVTVDSLGNVTDCDRSYKITKIVHML